MGTGQLTVSLLLLLQLLQLWLLSLVTWGLRTGQLLLRQLTGLLPALNRPRTGEDPTSGDHVDIIMSDIRRSDLLMLLCQLVFKLANKAFCWNLKKKKKKKFFWKKKKKKKKKK